jgi:hypothetical protein
MYGISSETKVAFEVDAMLHVIALQLELILIFPSKRIGQEGYFRSLFPRKV